MNPEDVSKDTETFIATKMTDDIYTTVFIHELRQFIGQITKQMADYHDQFDLNAFETMKMDERDIRTHVLSNLIKISRTKLHTFLNRCLTKYRKALIEPGTYHIWNE